MSFYVYIVTNKKNGTLYIGVTNNIQRRAFEHKSKSVPGFSSRYNLTRLVYAEEYPTAVSAISREKQLKNWGRDWKIKLIEAVNPEWKDLYADIL